MPEQQKYKKNTKLSISVLCLFFSLPFTYFNVAFAQAEIEEEIRFIPVIAEKVNQKSLDVQLMMIKETYKVETNSGYVPVRQWNGKAYVDGSELRYSKERGEKIKEEKAIPKEYFLKDILLLISRKGTYDDIEINLDHNGKAQFDARQLKKLISSSRTLNFEIKVIYQKKNPAFFDYNMSDAMRETLFSSDSLNETNDSAFQRNSTPDARVAITLDEENKIKRAGARFEVKADSVAYDTVLRLLWQRQTDKKKTKYQEAEKFCSNLNVNGLNAWRLPHLEELRSIIGPKGGLLDVKVFNGLWANPYWTDTQVLFNNGAYGHRIAALNINDNDLWDPTANIWPFNSALVICVKDVQ